MDKTGCVGMLQRHHSGIVCYGHSLATFQQMAEVLLARVSVKNPKLAFVDDDIMADQRHTTDFRAVGNISRLSHALDKIQR